MSNNTQGPESIISENTSEQKTTQRAKNEEKGTVFTLRNVVIITIINI